jgi:hypothetical protein
MKVQKRSKTVLRKIDCIMIRVEDVEAAVDYYEHDSASGE